MCRITFLSLVLWAMVGCNSSSKPATVDAHIKLADPRVQEKEFHDTRLVLTYMPPCMLEEMKMAVDTSEVVFRLNIFSEKLKQSKSAEAARAISYGLDSLFTLISGADSLPPLLAQRIANGNLRGAEYLLIFNRTALHNRQQVALVFRDRLFTNVRMEFAMDIFKIDSISCGL